MKKIIMLFLFGCSVLLSLPALAVNCQSLSVWNANDAYVGGTQVQFNNKAYQANHWTQNHNPETHSGQWQEWSLLGVCDDGSSSSGGSSSGGSSSGGSSSGGSSSGGGTVTCTGLQVWSSTTAYTGGAVVQHNNKKYTAKWWTQNHNPETHSGPDQEWALNGNCSDGGSSSSSSSSSGGSSSGGSSSGGTKPVIGYFAQWGVYQRNYHVKNIDTSGSASKISHIMYAFGNVTNGKCVIGDSYADYDRFYSAAESVSGEADSWDAGALRGSFNQLRQLKAKYPHIKVVWSFGGWTWSGGFGQAAANPQAFAESCYQLVNDPRWVDVFDGIDIDWEYPNECGLSCDTSGFDAYRVLAQALRQRFGSQIVSSAITADGRNGGKIEAADYGGAAQYLDFYMVMTYDFFGAFAPQGPTAPHSALQDYPAIPIAGFNAKTAMQKLQAVGVPKDKLLLGIGFYGRGWTGVTQGAPGGSATGAAPGTYEAGIEDYKVLRSSCPSTGTVAGTAYAYCGNNWWSYDTPDTVLGKMNYVQSENLGGAFFWEFSGDTANGELIQAIHNGLQ